MYFVGYNDIESELGESISWERLDNRRASRIAIYTDGSIDDSNAELEAIKSWHIEKLLKLKKALGPRLQTVVKAAEPSSWERPTASYARLSTKRDITYKLIDLFLE